MKADLIEVSGGYCLSYNQPGAAGKSMCLSPDEARQARDELLKAIPLGQDAIAAAAELAGFVKASDQPLNNAIFQALAMRDDALEEVAELKWVLAKEDKALEMRCAQVGDLCDSLTAYVSENASLKLKVVRLQAALTAAIG